MVAAAHSMPMVRLESVDDRELAAQVMTDPEMWERLSEDGQRREEFTAESIPDWWTIVAVRTPHGTAGVFLLHEVEEGIWQLHANILKTFRERYAAESGAGIMKWIDENLPDNAALIFGEAPVIFPDVIGFAKRRLGMRDVGETSPIQKDGKRVERRLLIVPRGGWIS